MLYHSLLEPEAGMYVSQLGLRLEGELGKEELRAAWAEAMRRHGVLRSGLSWEGLRQGVQVVEREVEVPWREAEWGEGWEEELSRYLEEDRRRGFELRRAPLMRLLLA